MSEVAGGPCRTVFVGAVEEGWRVLDALLEGGEPIAGIVTLKDEWAAGVSGAVPFDDLARRHGIPLLKVRDLNHPANVERLRAMRPDLILVIGWTRLLGREVLAVPRHGCIGFHASLLPRYRGRAPVNWALINGERETGNSMIYLDEGVDTGDIVDQRRIAIDDEDDCRTLYAKVSAAAIGMLREHLPALKSGRAPRRRQDESGATVMPRRRPEDGVVDWIRGARDLHNWVRALTHPYPGAFGFLEGRKVFIWKAAVGLAEGARGLPGTLLSIDARGVEVAAGAGTLLVLVIQAEGDEEGEAAESARRLGWRPGMRFGAPGAPDGRRDGR